MKHLIRIGQTIAGMGIAGSVATSALGIALGFGFVIVIGTACASALVKSAGDVAIDALKESKKEGAGEPA